MHLVRKNFLNKVFFISLTCLQIISYSSLSYANNPNIKSDVSFRESQFYKSFKEISFPKTQEVADIHKPFAGQKPFSKKEVLKYLKNIKLISSRMEFLFPKYLEVLNGKEIQVGEFEQDPNLINLYPGATLKVSDEYSIHQVDVYYPGEHRCGSGPLLTRVLVKLDKNGHFRQEQFVSDDFYFSDAPAFSKRNSKVTLKNSNEITVHSTQVSGEYNQNAEDTISERLTELKTIIIAPSGYMHLKAKY